MKKIIFLLLLVTIIFTGCTNSNTLTGDVKSTENTKVTVESTVSEKTEEVTTTETSIEEESQIPDEELNIMQRVLQFFHSTCHFPLDRLLQQIFVHPCYHQP